MQSITAAVGSLAIEQLPSSIVRSRHASNSPGPTSEPSGSHVAAATERVSRFGTLPIDAPPLSALCAVVKF